MTKLAPNFVFLKENFGEEENFTTGWNLEGGIASLAVPPCYDAIVVSWPLDLLRNTCREIEREGAVDDDRHDDDTLDCLPRTDAMFTHRSAIHNDSKQPTNDCMIFQPMQ